MDEVKELKYNFSIQTVEISGFVAALEALRLPFGKEARSDCRFDAEVVNEYETTDGRVWLEYWSRCEIDNKDIELMNRLMKNGDEHGKVLRGILVYAEINAPRYWWQEEVTYEVGAIKMGSNSTMHQECRGIGGQELIDMKENLPEGTMQKRMCCFSYQTLRRIYKQRYNHRLPHWQDFCHWVETLPYAEDLILDGLERCK